MNAVAAPVVPFICLKTRNDGLGSRRNMTAGKRSLLDALRLALLFAVRSINWELRLFPRFPATGNIPKLIEALLLQNARGDAGAVTAAAIHRRGFLTIKLSHPVAKLREENVMGAGDMPFLPFTRRTHIDNLQRRLAFIQLMHAHLPDSFERKPGCVPRFHSADQITREFCVSGANK